MRSRIFLLTILVIILFSSSLKANERKLSLFNQELKSRDISERFWEDNFLEAWWPWAGGVTDEEEDPNPFSSKKIVDLEMKLQERIVGQNHAIKRTVAALERYASGINDANAPIASLLYAGPTGVGKTQLAKELAKILFGSEDNLIQFNMSEYCEIHHLSRLIGSPPGYLDHAQGGELTNLLKQFPYSIVLFDEIEKAHPRVLKALLRLFDEGVISDSDGNLINGQNCLFIMTTNLDGQKILTMHDLGYTENEILKAIQPTMMSYLSPEVYNRLETIVFRGLKENLIDDLIRKMLNQATEEFKERKRMTITFDPSLVSFVKGHATDYLLGVRPIKNFIKQTIVTAIAEAFREGYIRAGDAVDISFHRDDLVIRNSRAEKPFLWEWKEEKLENKIPFKFDQLLDLENKLQQKVLGQPYAIKITVAALMRYAVGFKNANAPIGAFLYVGPTGVGKTQLAKELAVELLGSESHLIRLDMSEYSEPHSISRLIGSPPGYVNHDEGGQLTEALKKHPYTIILLDEIEKAHPTVLKTFLQVFDEGRLSDTHGTVIDCRNAIFILTTNLAARKILTMHEQGYQEEDVLQSIQQDIIKVLSPELYNRLEIACFMGLGSELLDQLIKKMLNEVQTELQNKQMISVEFDPSILKFLKANGYDYELGARPLKRLIQQAIITPIAREMIAKHVQSGDRMMLSYSDRGLVIEQL